MIRPRKLKALIILLMIIVGLANATGWDAVSDQAATKQFEEQCFGDPIGDCR